MLSLSFSLEMMRSALVIFDTGATYLCYSNKINVLDIEEDKSTINIKGITKCIGFYVFGIVGCYVRIETGCIIVLWYQEYYVSGSPTYFCIISPQVILVRRMQWNLHSSFSL